MTRKINIISFKGSRILISLLFLFAFSSYSSGLNKYQVDDYNIKRVTKQDSTNYLSFSNVKLIFITNDSSQYILVKTKCTISLVLKINKSVIICNKTLVSTNFSGLLIQIQSNSKIKSIAEYINGKRNGRTIFFRRNGTISYIDKYLDGNKVERVFTFDKSGNVIGKIIDVY